MSIDNIMMSSSNGGETERVRESPSKSTLSKDNTSISKPHASIRCSNNRCDDMLGVTNPEKKKNSFPTDVKTNANSRSNSVTSSITIVHKEELPSYPSERFYLLSEVQIMGRKSFFLCDNNIVSDDSNNETAASTQDGLDDDDEQSDMEIINKNYNESIGSSSHESRNLFDVSYPQSKKLEEVSHIIRKIDSSTESISSLESKRVTDESRMTLVATTENHSSSSILQMDATSTDHILLNNEATSLKSFAPYTILYLLWKPDMPSDPKDFSDSVLQYAMEQLEEQVDLIDVKQNKCVDSFSQAIRHDKENKVPDKSSHVPCDPKLVDDSNINSHVSETISKPKINVYLVIEMIRPDSSISNDDEDENGCRVIEGYEKDAKLLVQYVASKNSPWRNKISGITVGLSNQVRAAPALEASVSAISFGSRDRRRYMQQNNNQRKDSSIETNNIISDSDCGLKSDDIHRSMIGIVTMDPSDLLGLDEIEYPMKSSTSLYQSKIIAEYNSNGNMESFALRAHNTWRKIVGIPISQTENSISFNETERNSLQMKRRLPRRIVRALSSTGGNGMLSSYYRRGSGSGIFFPSRRNSHWHHQRQQSKMLFHNPWSMNSFYDLIALFVILGYIMFHFSQ